MGVLKRAYRGVGRRKVRALLVILALGLSISILVSMPAAMEAQTGLTESMVETQRTSYRGIINLTATEIVVGPPQISWQPTQGQRPPQNFFRSAFINQSIASEIALLPGVNDVIPQLQSIMILPTEEGTTDGGFPGGGPRMNFMSMIGVPLNSTLIDEYLLLPTNIIEGSTLSEGDSEAVLIGLDLKDSLDTQVSGTIDIDGSALEVVGIFDSGSSFTNRQAYMDLLLAQGLFDLTDQVSTIRVFAKSVDDVDGVVEAIIDEYGEEVSVTTEADLLERISTQYSSIEEIVNAQLIQAKGVTDQAVLISAIVGGMIVIFTMFYTVRERTKEIGILKALGFTKGDVMVQFMLEGVMISLMGGLAGVVIGSLGAPIIANLLLPSISFLGVGGRFGQASQQLGGGLRLTDISLDINLILLGLVVAVLMGVLGSLYPSWWASRKSPSEALKYE